MALTFPFPDRPDRNVQTCFARSLLVFFCATLAACGGGLKGDRIAQMIKDDVVTLGGISLKSVTCPPNITPQKDAQFECTGELDTGYTFTIGVTQRDDKGQVTWDVPNTPTLLNIAKIEALIQDSLKAELGDRPTVDCDGTYKPIRPGQSFDCKLQYSSSKSNAGGKPSKAPTEKIVVLVDQQGSIGWQRVFKDGTPKTATAATAATVKSPERGTISTGTTSPGSAAAEPKATAVPASPTVAPVQPARDQPSPARSPLAANTPPPGDAPGSSSEPTYQDTLKWQD